MYISVHPSFQNGQTILKYSKTEIVDDIDDIEHACFKAALKRLNISGVEITSTADIPAGTGLGSSSSFAVGLLHSLSAYNNRYSSKEFLAGEACDIELNILGKPIGKQDQYAAAYGGLNFYTFKKDGTVFVDPVFLPPDSMRQLQKNLMLFYVQGEHNAGTILSEQAKNIDGKDGEEKTKRICELTYELRDRLSQNDIDAAGKIMHENWILKRSLAPGITNDGIDALYKIAVNNGASGGKLLGAGGAGFLLLYVPESKQNNVRSALPVPEQKFLFDKQGSCIIYAGDQ